MFRRAVGGVAAGAIVLLAAGSLAAAALPRPTPPLDPPLRVAAAQTGLLVGTAVREAALYGDPAYARGVAREYNALTAENEMKWATLRPTRTSFDFGAADAIVSFAAAHGMAVRGHTLVWFEQNPSWLVHGRFSRDEMIGLLRDHIHAVVGRYRGRIVQWDVVNEAVTDTGRLRRNIWLDRIGPDYLDVAFRAAREADPSARLYYNDYGFEQGGPKTDAIFSLLTRLRARGVPVDGLGFQLHVNAERWRAPAVARTMARAAALGLDVAVTELDVRLPHSPSGDERRRQTEVYGQAVRTCRASPACHTLVTWGWTDRYSWIPGRFKGMGSALPFGSDLAPKAAARALQTALSGR